MCRRKEPVIANELLDQLLAGGTASAAFERGGLLDSLKKALTERALNAEMDHPLARGEDAGNTRSGYGRKTVTTETGKLEIDVPRDRQSSFDLLYPQAEEFLVALRSDCPAQRRPPSSMPPTPFALKSSVCFPCVIFIS
jgi:hypothetical protein